MPVVRTGYLDIAVLNAFHAAVPRNLTVATRDNIGILASLRHSCIHTFTCILLFFHPHTSSRLVPVEAHIAFPVLFFTDAMVSLDILFKIVTVLAF